MAEKSHYAYDAVTEVSESSNSGDARYQVAAPNQPATIPSKHWPQGPSNLVPDRMQSLLTLAYDVALVTFPVLLILKTGLVLLAYHIDKGYSGDNLDFVSPMTEILIQVNGQLITIFAIAFVTIMSTLVRRYALYKAQSGAYIAELEQLQGSTGLLSTLKLTLALRAYSLLSLGLLIAWCFQYLGSQANKYEYRLLSTNASENIAINIQGNSTPTIFELGNASDIEFRLPTVRMLLTQFMSESSSFASQKVAAGTDLRGNVLIPDLAALNDPKIHPKPSDRPKQNRDGWFDVSRTSQTKLSDSFVSPIGLYFSEEPPLGSTEVRTSLYIRYLGRYQVASSYLRFVCAAPTLRPYTGFPANTSDNQLISLNMIKLNGSEPRDRFGNPLRSFEYWSRLDEGSAVAVCSVTRLHYDVRIICKETGCVTREMRWMNGDSFELANNYSTPFDKDDAAAMFLDSAIQASQTNDLYQLDPGPEIESAGVKNLTTPQAWDLVSYDVTRVFGIALNTLHTLLQLDYNADSVTGGAATFHGAEYNPHYAISPVFIAIDLLSSFILLAAAVASVLLRMWTVAPDILGAVSSLSRDNPYLDLPATGSTLDGLSRARLLRRVKVKLGDVSGQDGEIGRIALARVDTGYIHVTPLQKTRRYV